MYNRVVLVGNLTRDIEMRYTPTGTAVGATGIAVTRKFTTNGEKREETCFVDISFFGRTAEIANQYLSKGSKVLVEGRLKYEQWTDQNGQNRSKHTISVENMEMLGSSAQGSYAQSGTQGYAQGANQGKSYDPYAEQAPAKQNAKTAKNQAQQQQKFEEIDSDGFDTDDTELPF